MQGTYNNYQCGLKISGAQAEDAGDWTCEIESYVKNGKRGDGYTAKVILLYLYSHIKSSVSRDHSEFNK